MADKYSEDLELECSCGINIVWKIIDLETTMKLSLWMLIIKLSLAFEWFVKKINKVAYMIKSYLLWLPFFFYLSLLKFIVCHIAGVSKASLWQHVILHTNQSTGNAHISCHLCFILFLSLFIYFLCLCLSSLSSPLQKGLLLLLLLSVSGFSSIAHHHFHCVSKHCSESISVA